MRSTRDLYLLVDESVDDLAKEFAVETIEKFFNLRLKLAPLKINLKIAYDRYRRQYNAENLLNVVASGIIDGLFMVMLHRDIFVPGLNYVFGVALPFVGCVISTWRLKSPDQNLYHARVSRTIKHELGHVFGLLHCNRRCVMVFANSLLELDLKFDDFCDKCKRYLLGMNILRKFSDTIVQ
ncbi:MAG: hypothetical protein NDP13_02715 [Crenarchaeota archaeon]|nr:hypothetical protein [Thermoproteota archaeon]MCR8500784.1 hypothetical protein [Thermoproteota archaeon]